MSQRFDCGVFSVDCIDYPVVFDLLRHAGYDGWPVVEADRDPAVVHRLTFATHAFGNPERIAPDAGLP